MSFGASRRDSSVMRKASSGSDITSPSSHHIAKTTTTDRGEAISCYIYYELITLLIQAFTLGILATFFSYIL